MFAMGTGPGLREKKNARMREAIERAALELALEQGFDHTTVEQIAERADVSPRTVFLRYPTKDAIVFGDPDQETRLPEALASGAGDLVDRVLLFVGAAAAERNELERLRTRAIIHDPYLRRQIRGRLEVVEQLIAQTLAAELALPSDDAGIRAFGGAVTGVFLTMLDFAVGRPDIELEELFDGCRRGIDVLRASLAVLESST
jgi:AcrR family transcriptional regulator